MLRLELPGKKKREGLLTSLQCCYFHDHMSVGHGSPIVVVSKLSSSSVLSTKFVVSMLWSVVWLPMVVYM